MQLAQVIAPLKLDGDGVHRLSIHLHPADLGPVNVVAELRNGDIHIHLAGATDAGREALRQALPELRRELQSAGYGSASFDMSHQAPQEQPGRPGQAPSRYPGEREQATAAPVIAPPPPPTGSTANRQLDLHV
jgi:flagellar hook-length control protein FliK